ncbi:MAG: hypothetical protein V2I74_10230 [Erythrobacter sp.]|nr:hypothetical protein [Erythrobacter sp.]
MRASARGAPLAMIGMLLAAWIGGRALVWQSPFAAPETLLRQAPPALADAARLPSVIAAREAILASVPSTAIDNARQGFAGPRRLRSASGEGTMMRLGSGFPAGLAPRLAAGHEMLWRAAMRAELVPAPLGASVFSYGAQERTAPFLPSLPSQTDRTGAPAAGRWSVDAWGFWRQGSDAAPIAQGRVPIYGASQVGAVLQYRIAPQNRRDPRLYARAYRAMVRRGESEIALGGSARPVPGVPVRVFGELRLTDGAFRTQARPAAFAVTEIAPIALPLDTSLETYGQAGWVGGTDDTFFADGQASLTRDIAAVASASDNAVRLSLGAGAWGGAQKGAHRVDLGPTMRLDMRVGEVPARLSLDWRERVGGDAGPESGMAVTLSTSF